MTSDPKTNAFEAEWFDLAKKIVSQIAADPEIMEMRASFAETHTLTFEQRSQFVSIANKVKAAVMHEVYGAEATPEFEEFKERWRNWYDNKGVTSTNQGLRRLTNEEHIVYSSTPDAEEFFSNLEHTTSEASS